MSEKTVLPKELLEPVDEHDADLAGMGDFVERLYKKHWKDLCHWLRWRYGAGPPDPEDIAQTAFVKIAAMDDHSNILNPKAFLFTVASNTALKGIQWLARTQRYVEKELHEVGQNVEEISPDRVYSSRERFNAVTEQMALLSDKQQDLIYRSRILGQKYDQISAETGWSMADISRQLKTALSTIHTALGEYENDGK